MAYSLLSGEIFILLTILAITDTDEVQMLKLLCKIGLHRWNDWNCALRMEDGKLVHDTVAIYNKQKVIEIVHYSICKLCGKIRIDAHYKTDPKTQKLGDDLIRKYKKPLKKNVALMRDESKKRAEAWKKEDAKAIAIKKRLDRARAIHEVIKEPCSHTKNDALAALRSSIQHWQIDIISPFKKGNVIKYVYSYQKKQYTYVWKKHDSLNYQSYLKIEQHHCALCSLYAPFCQFCPLQKITGNACSYYESVYSRFLNELSLKTAKDMINALICAYWALINNEL